MRHGVVDEVKTEKRCENPVDAGHQLLVKQPVLLGLLCVVLFQRPALKNQIGKFQLSFDQHEREVKIIFKKQESFQHLLKMTYALKRLYSFFEF